MRLSDQWADRPRYELERTPLHGVFDIAAWVFVVCNALVVFYYWPDLPERVPSHLNAAGEVDGWSSPMFMWFLPALSLVLVAGLSWLERYPHTYNYLWPITEENAKTQYRLAREMVAGLKATCALLFLSISWMMSQLAFGRVVPNVGWVVFLQMALLFGGIGVYIVRAARER